MANTSKLLNEVNRVLANPNATVRDTSAEFWAGAIETVISDQGTPGRHGNSTADAERLQRKFAAVASFSGWERAVGQPYAGPHSTGSARIVEIRRPGVTQAIWEGEFGICSAPIGAGGDIEFDRAVMLPYTAPVQKLSVFFEWLRAEWQREVQASGGQLEA